ncbi:hypothetical protein BDF22DRAFT_501931 [Syncephalis plumigaleata]|nr:hypothetical protein BDF22DRAFT_501931 [Syncephalis plumigaleata]
MLVSIPSLSSFPLFLLVTVAVVVSSMSSVQTDNPSVISHPLSAEALAEVERENEENELRKAFPVKQSDDADASSLSQQETTTSTTVEVLKEEQMSDQSSTTDTVQNTTRRAAPTLVKSSWLPVRPFSFFTTEEDDVITLVGQNTIAHALWTRLHQQHKEDTDLLAFLQARKAILLLPQTVMENTSNVTCIERVDLLDHILVRQLPISTSEMKLDDLKDTPDDHQYWLTSLSGHTVVIDKQQHAIWLCQIHLNLQQCLLWKKAKEITKSQVPIMRQYYQMTRSILLMNM